MYCKQTTMFAFLLFVFSHSIEIFEMVALCSDVYKVLHNVDTAHIAKGDRGNY